MIYKNDYRNLNIWDVEIFFKNYSHKTSIFFKYVDIKKVFVSNKISFGEKNYKYFIGYLYNDNKVKPTYNGS